MRYYKLVRDKIPQIIEAQGKTCQYSILDQQTYLEMLDAKLNEELAEYQESKSLEELADLYEVMLAVLAARGYTPAQLLAAADEKRAERGGFARKILLTEVT